MCCCLFQCAFSLYWISLFLCSLVSVSPWRMSVTAVVPPPLPCQVLVVAPSNVAVDQLTEKIHATVRHPLATHPTDEGMLTHMPSLMCDVVGLTCGTSGSQEP